MKRIIAIMLMVSLMLAASGCNSNASETAEVIQTDSVSLTENFTETNSIDNGDYEISHEEITISHKLGETTLTTNPERIVVTDYGILDCLDYAGVDTVVGIPKSGHVPSQLSKYESDEYAELGNLVEVDFEAINELQPDLIIITSRLTDSYEELSKIAPTLFLTMPAATYMDTFEENLNILKQVFTVQADKFETELDSILERTANIAEASEGKSALLIQTNDESINVFGIGSRYASVYTDFGFTITDDTIAASTHGQSASFEYVAEQNPDYLFIIDRSAALSTDGATGAQVLMDNELIADMDAAKNDKIFYLDSTNWYTVAGGIYSTISMLEEMENALGIEA